MLCCRLWKDQQFSLQQRKKGPGKQEKDKTSWEEEATHIIFKMEGVLVIKKGDNTSVCWIWVGRFRTCVRLHYPHCDVFICVDALLCGNGCNAGFYYIVMFLSCSDRTHSIAGVGRGIFTVIPPLWVMCNYPKLTFFPLFFYRHKDCVCGKPAMVSIRWRTTETYVHRWESKRCDGSTIRWHQPFKRLGVSYSLYLFNFF